MSTPDIYCKPLTYEDLMSYIQFMLKQDKAAEYFVTGTCASAPDDYSEDDFYIDDGIRKEVIFTGVDYSESDNTIYLIANETYLTPINDEITFVAYTRYGDAITLNELYTLLLNVNSASKQCLIQVKANIATDEVNENNYHSIKRFKKVYEHLSLPIKVDALQYLRDYKCPLHIDCEDNILNKVTLELELEHASDGLESVDQYH